MTIEGCSEELQYLQFFKIYNTSHDDFHRLVKLHGGKMQPYGLQVKYRATQSRVFLSRLL